MSKDNNTIHEFNLDMICEYFSNVERQGPGSPEVILKALSFIEDLTDDSRIADIGCGSGGQTMFLAESAPGHITAIDMFPRFIDILNKNAGKSGLSDRINGIVGKMEDLSFQDEELDLIWSEGAIYNIGFEKGLSEWRRYLRKGGHIAVTEACWFTDERPAEIDKFWMDAYPGIDTIPNKLKQLQSAGYVPLASFILPENCWIEHFFEPQEKVQEDFLKKYAGNQAAEGLIEYMRLETQLYHKYKSYYGYAFFIGKKL